MRNLSMKKFGTPIGAGPGEASHSVGVDGGGWPSGPGVGSCVGASAEPLPLESLLLEPSLESELLDEDPDPEPELSDPDEGCDGFWPLLGLTWTWTGAWFCCVGCGCAGVMSWTATIGVVTPGILIWSTGVPGGTSTVTVICCPPSSVTSSVRCSADAGIVAAPKPARNNPAVANPMSSLRLCMRRSDALRAPPGGVTLAWRILGPRRTVLSLFEGN